MMQKFIKTLKNPRVQKALLWVGPIIIGWLFDRANKASSKKSVRSKRIK